MGGGGGVSDGVFLQWKYCFFLLLVWCGVWLFCQWRSHLCVAPGEVGVVWFVSDCIGSDEVISV